MTGFGSVKQAASVVRHGALAAAIAVAAFSSAAVAEERPVFLDRKQLACIVEHLDAYLALEGDPLVIVVDFVPERRAGAPLCRRTARG